MNVLRKTGTYQKTSTTGEAVAAFVPFPLPPTPSVEVDDKIRSLLNRAEEKLNELDASGNLVPSLDWFIYAYVRKEAVTSSQIEGTQATLADLFSMEGDPSAKPQENPDLEEVCGYISALQYARTQLASDKGLPLSIRLLNETHKKLMKGTRGGTKEPGLVRRSQNWIGGTRPGNAVFVPPPPQELPRLLSDLEKYFHGEDEVPKLIRIGLCHVQFETIHPYLDGNGRMGRLLITLLMEHWGYLKQPLLYLSFYLKKWREEYYRLLGHVRESGDWEAWIRFFLEGVAQVAEDATGMIGHLSAIVTRDRRKVLASDASTLFTARLFEFLPLHPILNASLAVKILKTSKPTALKAIAGLESLGILKECTGRKRDRLFEYADYLKKLKIGTELLTNP